MGFNSVVLGIFIESHNPSLHTLLTLIAKQVKFYIKPRVVKTYTPDTYKKLVKRIKKCDGEYNHMKLYLHDDIGYEGTGTAEFDPNQRLIFIEGEDDICEFQNLYYRGDNNVKIGNPNGCAFMLYIGSCHGNGERVTTIPDGTVENLNYFVKCLNESNRLPKNVTSDLCLVRNCCS